jgi:penicillin-insensitive murein DD-endopeptidase
MRFFYFVLLLPVLSCQSQTEVKKDTTETPKLVVEQSEIEKYATEYKDNGLPSESIGSEGNGSLKNGKLMPFSGKNFRYFDTLSYLSGRAFTHENLRSTLLGSFDVLDHEFPGRQFCYMECSNEQGGKIQPHRTHQTGLSVDMMTPLKKKGEPFYGFDSIGATHYLLEFDDNGISTRDPEVSIDFEVLAKQLWIIEQEARKNGLKISKVIFKLELKDELFRTTYGKKLNASDIYFAKNLQPMINALHDDHFHIDFEPLVQ